MKHRRGIELAAPFQPAHSNEDPDGYITLKDLGESRVLGAKCGECQRVSWLNSRAVMQAIGNQHLMHLKGKLRCSCGNRDGNKILIGKLPR